MPRKAYMLQIEIKEKYIKKRKPSKYTEFGNNHNEISILVNTTSKITHIRLSKSLFTQVKLIVIIKK